MDIMETLDSKVLLYIGTAISFVNAVFNVSPSYNFPLYLFSIYAYERENSNDSLRYSTGLVGSSMVLDIIWLSKTSGQNGFSKALTIILLILKAPTMLALLNYLRTRGAGFNIGESGSLSGGNTIWSMPGGFSSSAGGGYQALGGDREEDLEPGSGAGGRPAPPPRAPKPQNNNPINHHANAGVVRPPGPQGPTTGLTGNHAAQPQNYSVGP